jgi:hypothetical protein
MHTFKTPKGTELPFLNLKGKDYLQVAHRIVWFREAHPDWTILTKIVHFNAEWAVVEATISDAAGKVLSNAHKTQTAKGFPGGYLEKAEAGAVGRALAFIGYGTAFAQELEEDEDVPMSAIADSPLEKKRPVQAPVNAPRIAPLSTKVNTKPSPEEQASCSHKWFKSKFKEGEEYCGHCRLVRKVKSNNDDMGNIPY